METIGIAKKARDIGYKGTCLFIWMPCQMCKKERWVKISAKGILKSQHCKCCAGKARRDKNRGPDSYNWKGGRQTTSDGYTSVWISPNDFFYPMANVDNYVLEHRLVMAKHLGRCLQSWEVVHHKNGIRDDNRPENLELSSRGAHIRDNGKGYRDGYIKGLRDGRLKRIRELEDRIRELEVA